MKYKIWNYFIVIAVNSLFLLSLSLPGYAQKVYRKVPRNKALKDKTEKVHAPDTIPFYQGVYIGADLYGLGSKLFSDCISSEISVKVNLKNKFIPALELGMGAADSWNETGIHYKSKATPFIRLGLDYNTMAKKKNKNSYLYVGCRYALSSFSYDVSSLPATDPIWNDQINNPAFQDNIWKNSVPFNQLGIKGSMQWFEFLVGVKIQVYKRLNMGWDIRLKYKTSGSSNTYADPWYVPGYGQYKSSNMGLTYSIIYKLPF